jgi:hypothetical protein
MTSDRKSYDVFISHTPSDTPLAAQLAETFRINGLEPFTGVNVPAREEFSDTLWEALSECKALLAIFSRSGPSPAMGVEIGAAQAWGKPIYAVSGEAELTRLPISLSHLRFTTSSNIEEVIQEIRRSAELLNSEDREILKTIYVENRVPADRLALHAPTLLKIGEDFQRKTSKRVDAERLLSELLRMRKRGELPRIAAPDSTPGRRPA